jgi:hypothetical protein
LGGTDLRKEPSTSEAQPTKRISGQSANPFLRFSPEYKIQDVRQADFNYNVLQKQEVQGPGAQLT